MFVNLCFLLQLTTVALLQSKISPNGPQKVYCSVTHTDMFTTVPSSSDALPLYRSSYQLGHTEADSCSMDSDVIIQNEVDGKQLFSFNLLVSFSSLHTSDCLFILTFECNGQV